MNLSDNDGRNAALLGTEARFSARVSHAVHVYTLANYIETILTVLSEMNL